MIDFNYLRNVIDENTKEPYALLSKHTEKVFQVFDLLSEKDNRLANELIGDFKEVEDNFKEITRKIYEKQQNNDLTKGKILAETFDSLYELKKTNQGKSFYAFWQFMIDDMSQQEFQQLTKEALSGIGRSKHWNIVTIIEETQNIATPGCTESTR